MSVRFEHHVRAFHRGSNGASARIDWRATGTENFPRDRSFDLKHLKLDLSLDHAKGEVRGTASHTLAPLHDGLSRLTLDAVELDVSGIREGKRKLSFACRDGALEIDLGKPFPEGRSFTIEVDYSARPRKGLFFIRPDAAYPRKPRQIWSQGEMEDNRHWFPCYDAPNDKCTTEVVLTVDRRFTALSNGRLLSSKPGRRGTRVWHWLQEVPHVTYLVSIAVGEFDTLRERWEGIPVEYHVPKGRRKDLRSTFARTRDMLSFFSDRIGLKYPYDKYSQVVVSDFTFGGMENTSLTILTDRCIVPERLLAETDSDGLLAHELAHQWWGDLVTTKSWAHLWLNEGFASYFDPLYCEHAKGQDEFHLSMRGEAEAYLAEDRVYRRPIVTHRWVIAEDMFDRHTYCKGAWVLHMLRWALGDALFWKGIRHYVRTHARKNVETSDLKVAMEEATGRSLDAFFQQWLHRGGHPDFEVSWAWDDAGYVRLTVKQAQRTDETTPLFRMPVEVVLDAGASQRAHRIEVSKAEETFLLEAAKRPKAVYFDPGYWILKTVKFKRGSDELLHQLASGPTAMCRIEAAEALSRQEPAPRSVEGLAKALRKDPFHGVRAAAARALAAFHLEGAARELLAGLKDRDGRVRRASASACGDLKPEWVETALAAAARRDKSDLVRAAALSALGRCRSKRAFAALSVGTRQASWNDCVRAAAVGGLAEAPEEKGVGLALRFAGRGQVLATRTAAVGTLARHWERFQGRREQIRDALVDLLQDPEHLLRGRVAGALGDLEDPKVRQALSRAEETDLMWGTRRAARLSLDKLNRAREGRERFEALETELKELKGHAQELRSRVATLEARKKRK